MMNNLNTEINTDMNTKPRAVYLMAEPSNSADYIETPPSLVMEINEDVLNKIKAVSQHVREITAEQGVVVLGTEILDWSVQSHSACVQSVQGGIEVSDTNMLVSTLPDCDSGCLDDRDYCIDLRGLRVRDTDVQMFAWSKYSDIKMLTSRVSIEEPEAAYNSLQGVSA